MNGVTTTTDDFYDYDPKDSFSAFNFVELVPTTVVYGLTFIFGFTGNVLIIFIVSRYQRMRTISNIFLASLAAADLLLIVTCIPVMLARLYSYTWTMGQFCCILVYYMQNLSTICSVLTLTAISLERFYAVIFPMKAKYTCTTRNTRIVIISVWFLSLILAIPVVFLQVHMPVGTRVSGFWCVPNWDNVPYWRIYEWYMLTLVLIIPFTVMSIAYLIICCKVWSVIKQRSGMSSQNKTQESYRLTVYRSSNNAMDGKTRTRLTVPTSVMCTTSNKRVRDSDDQSTLKQVIKMLLAVVVLFLLSWAPLLVINLLTAYQILPELNIGIAKYLRITFRIMAYMNSCINPLVYGFMSKSFRDSIKATFRLVIQGRQSTRFSARSSRTRNMSLSRHSAPSVSMNY
ncbi:Uncharacterised protein r2_g3385 [Pycnogonum litorale]